MPKNEDPEIEEEDLEDIDVEDDDDSSDGEEYMDMGGMLAQVLATPEGDTVCTALLKIANAMETQNKILVKILSAVSTRKGLEK